MTCPTDAPELLAPAGNWDCARAAIENGADAIYFGLEAGFNARARADNFHIGELKQLMKMLHRQAVRGYVTLNTLVFTDELSSLELHVRQLAEAGTDAVLVQDLGVARLVREICPELPIHASTQMTLTCAAAIELASQLYLQRVVLPREASLSEIRKISAATPMPLEAFVHGALCVAYSGQCLTSESFGGRSANRGQCAQACRLPYDIYSDGVRQDLGEQKYLLSPQDLAAHDLIPELLGAGVTSMKIEGRLKTPEYVANVCQHYRAAIDAALKDKPLRLSVQQRRELEQSFSRGFSPGWLEGCDHKRLVPGLSSSKRGVAIGKVRCKTGDGLLVELVAPVAPGDGIVLEGDRFEGKELGGRIYEIFADGRKVETAQDGVVELRLKSGLLRDAEIEPAANIWKTDDPQLTKRLRRSFETADPIKRVDIDIAARIAVGESLTVTAVSADGASVTLQSDHEVAEARKHVISSDVLREQLSRLGGSVYRLRELDADIHGSPMVPLSVLGSLRREMIERLDAARQPQELPVSEPNAVMRMLASVKPTLDEPDSASELSRQPAPLLRVLCRSLEQIRQVLAAGATHIIADLHDLRQNREAVELARSSGATIELATLRIHKQGEDGLFTALAKAEADGWLVRSLAAAYYCRSKQIPFACDFSLNVTNPLTAQQLLQWGASRITASYDLNRDQLLQLASQLQAGWMEVVVHQHMPMFHMEHCVFCSVLSPGRSKSDCGRPCDRHDVQLEDRVGMKHVLHADIGCRNTLYNATAQSGAEAVSGLQEAGVRQFRIELLRDTDKESVEKLLHLYRGLIAGDIAGREVWQQLKADNRVGVTRGTLEQPRNPLAIL